jgi:hypothetical protein
MRLRIAIGSVGVLLGLFGVFRLLTQVPLLDIVVLLGWLAAALVLHDGVLSPIVLGIGAAITRVLPARAAGYVQGGLVAGGLITVIAVPMIYRQGSQPSQKALLEQNYSGNLVLLLALVLGGTVVLYLARLAFDARAAKRRPSQDQDSATT